MIITDGVHLASTKSVVELHAFAAKVGLSRRRFHGMRKGHPHYDLKSDCVIPILEAGARDCDTRSLLRFMARQ